MEGVIGAVKEAVKKDDVALERREVEMATDFLHAVVKCSDTIDPDMA